MVREEDLQIRPGVYRWTGRALSVLERVLKVNIKLHHEQGQVEAGDIFLFNHFARFETFVPQYLIYRMTGSLSRSVAAAEFFRGADPLARYLRHLGAVPNNLPNIFPFLAKEILRGRKVVMFPEGGMVKDRRVLDRAGDYSVYSRTSKERRRHHTGAAVLALAVAAAKRGVLEAQRRGADDQIEAWAQQLGLEDAAALVRTAERATTIVPANITFYPMRVAENLLQRGAEMMMRGMEPRLAEELQVEGNILFSDTDMDIRLQDPVQPEEFLNPWQRRLLTWSARGMASLEEALDPRVFDGNWFQRRWYGYTRRAALRIRDAYMVAMYGGVTVNLSHLAARTIYRLLERGVDRIAANRLQRVLYLAVKQLQRADEVHQHRSLHDPSSYSGLLTGTCPGLSPLLETAVRLELLAEEDGMLHFLPKMRQDFSFDEVRLENPILVYANEVEPVGTATRAVDAAMAQESVISSAEVAGLRFDDEMRQFDWDRTQYGKARHAEVNAEEPATASGAPGLWLPQAVPAALPGVLLVHGFTASPAEMEPLAAHLSERGFPVLSVRLKGHGTSPWDLLERSWDDWLDSVRRGFEILRDLARRVAVVGFSGGGALALCLAAEHPSGLEGVVAVAAPLKVRDKALSLVPLVHGANVLVDAVTTGKGVKLFHRTAPEHPHINYHRMPIRSLYELGQLMEATRLALPAVHCPVLVIQGDEDPTVVPSSAQEVYDNLASAQKELRWVASDRHGLLYENVDQIYDDILRFLEGLDQTPGWRHA